MISDLEIYRAANQLVKRYGEDAELEAAMRVTTAHTLTGHSPPTAQIGHKRTLARQVIRSDFCIAIENARGN